MKFECKDCLIPQSLAHFHYFAKGKPTRYVCKDCWNKRQRARPQQHRYEYHKNYYLKRNFNITLAEYNKMLHNQNGVCAICKTTSTETLAVDHCHTTGNIRGLLCMTCNHGLGNFKDQEDLLLQAIEYLKNKTGVFMTIDGLYYKNDIRAILKSGALNLAQIKAKLEEKKIKLDETQILDALDSLIKSKVVARSDGKFNLVTFS